MGGYTWLGVFVPLPDPGNEVDVDGVIDAGGVIIDTFLTSELAGGDQAAEYSGDAEKQYLRFDTSVS